VDGENRELFEVGDVDAVVRAADALLADGERRAAMGRAAATKIRSLQPDRAEINRDLLTSS
jgi:hypothetical protein